MYTMEQAENVFKSNLRELVGREPETKDDFTNP